MSLTFTRGTTLEFSGTVGADVAWSIEGTTNNNGRQSAQQDLALAARTHLQHWRIFIEAQATPTLGNSFELYIKTSDGTHLDNDDGTGDIALSSIDKLKNLIFLGVVICDEAAANIEYGTTGLIELYERFVHVVGFNTFGSTINATDSNSGFLMTPVDYADV